MLTVTIGISAYNEENNIFKLLSQIAEQEISNFELKEVIVISDGSTDNTVAEASKIKLPQLRVIAEPDRKGKSFRLNQIFEQNNSNVLVLFDGDIVLGDRHVVSNLVGPFEDESVGLVCGWHRSLPARTFIEKLAVFGVEVWEDAIDSLRERSAFYRCTGQVRALSQDLVTKFIFPEGSSQVEDLYCYYQTLHFNKKIVFIPEALVYERQPSAFGDYIKRNGRTIQAQSGVQIFASTEEIRVNQCLTERDKLRALLKKMYIVSPLISVSYILLQIVTRISIYFQDAKNNWDVSTTTKEI